MKCGVNYVAFFTTLKGLNFYVTCSSSTLSGLDRDCPNIPAFHTGLFMFNHFVVLVTLKSMEGSIKDYRFEILFPVITRCIFDLKRFTDSSRSFSCLMDCWCARLRQRSKLLRFRLRRINRITSFSFSPNCRSMASKGVRSSQAISMMRSWSRSERGGFSAILGGVGSIQSSVLFTTDH
jgi:hypothetical protein